MPKSAPLQSDFTGGEISPYAQGRVAEPWYKKSMATCLNAIPMIQGAWTRRPGSKYIASPGASTVGGRLIPFLPAFGSNSMIWMAQGTFKCYQGYTLVNTIAALASYSVADIRQFKYLQNGRYIYFFHTKHSPFYLGDPTNVGYPTTIGSLVFQDGPYLNANLDGNGIALTSTQLTVGTGLPGDTVAITASAVTGINGGSGFQSTDVGRFLRVNTTYTGVGTGLWSVLNITTVTDTTHAHGVLVGCLNAGGSATSAWAFGSIIPDPTGSYQPSCATIYGGRLWIGGAGAYPRRLDASDLSRDISQDSVNIFFSPTQLSKGLVVDSNGLDFTLFSKDAQNTVWLEGDERGILMGTTGDEWTVRPDTLNGAITPTNVDAKSSTFFGSAPDVAPVKVGKSILFVQRSTLKIREIFYAFDIGGYRAPDRTRWAEHITGSSGVIEMAHQREPQSIIWCVRADGTMCALTHEEENGEIAVGWHRHELGHNAVGSAQVVSVAVMPSSDGTHDEVWLLVNRTFSNGGGTSQYIEIIQPISNQYITDANQCFLDFSTVVTNGSPSKTLTGLSLYNGLVVNVWADGAPYGQFTVSGGQIVLPIAVSKAIVGFDYNSDAQLNRIEAGSADGTALGKIRRIHRVAFVLQQTLSLQIGMSFDDLTALNFRTQDTPPGVGQPSFSGIRLEEIDADYDTENQLCWRANGGAPCTVLAVCPRMDTQDAQ